jgi:two-component system, OmpR family, sensor histidine kinase KdpD
LLGSLCHCAYLYAGTSQAYNSVVQPSAKTLIRRYAISLVTIALVVFVYKRLLVVNPTTVALTLLVLVLLSSAYWGLRIAVLVAVLATAVFNFFFLPPFGTFTIADAQNWIALIAFLLTALVASNLSERVRREAADAREQRRNIERLYRLSQQFLTVENVPALMNAIPKFITDSFETSGAALLTNNKPTIYRSHPGIAFDPGTLQSTIARGEPSTSEGVSYIPLRLGIRTVGALAIVGSGVSRETADAIGSLVGTAIERTRAVDELTETRAAQENERLRSALLDSVTHEFRTPLTSIMASVSGLISDNLLDREQRKELLTVVQEEATRLNRLIGEAAEMAQLDAHLVKLELRRQSISEIVETVIDDLRGVLKNHPLEVNIPGDLPNVTADFERIQEVVRHLVENAAKYSPLGTPIRITAESKAGKVVTSVADRGPGIDSLEQSLIFDKFYRGRRERYAAHGTGMGLAIAKVIVEAHGGTINVVSQLGSGSVFSFALPESR